MRQLIKYKPSGKFNPTRNYNEVNDYLFFQGYSQNIVAWCRLAVHIVIYNLEGRTGLDSQEYSLIEFHSFVVRLWDYHHQNCTGIIRRPTISDIESALIWAERSGLIVKQAPKNNWLEKILFYKII